MFLFVHFCRLGSEGAKIKALGRKNSAVHDSFDSDGFIWLKRRFLQGAGLQLSEDSCDLLFYEV